MLSRINVFWFFYYKNYIRFRMGLYYQSVREILKQYMITFKVIVLSIYYHHFLSYQMFMFIICLWRQSKTKTEFIKYLYFQFSYKLKILPMIIIKMTIKNVKTVKLRLLNDIFKSFCLFALSSNKKIWKYIQFKLSQRTYKM